jgi:hypothetical protein
MRNKRGNATRKNERLGTPKKTGKPYEGTRKANKTGKQSDKERKKKAVLHLCGTKIFKLSRMT